MLTGQMVYEMFLEMLSDIDEDASGYPPWEFLEPKDQAKYEEIAYEVNAKDREVKESI